MATRRDAPSPSAASRSAEATLSREQIARAALERADRDGIEALSMRRLAEDLGVGTMTLYGYFRDKDELLDAAVDVAARQIVLPARRGNWRTQLQDLWREVQRALAAHPSGIHLRLRRPLNSPGALRTTEATLRILGDAGFPEREAALALRALFLYTFGFATFNQPGAPEELTAAWRGRLTALPAEEFSHVPAAAEELIQSLTGREPFEYGLALILDGLELRLRRRREEPGP